MSVVFSDFMINQHVNSQVELQKVVAERDEFHRCLLAREESLKQEGDRWVKAMEDRDTLISVLKECVVALDYYDEDNTSRAHKCLIHAKSTLSKYER